jgi:glycosyltransferase involved in cell wall biosynthesis
LDLLFISNQPPYPLHNFDRELLFHLANELTLRHYVIDLACFYDQPEALADVPRYQHLFRNVELIRLPKIPPSDIKKRFQKAEQPKEAVQAWSPAMWQTVQHWVSERRYIAAQLMGSWEVDDYQPLLRLLPQLLVLPQAQALRANDLAAHSHDKSQQRHWQQEADQAQMVEARLAQHFPTIAVFEQRHADALGQLAPQAPPVRMPFGVDMEYYVPTGHDPRLPTLLFTANFENPIELQAALRLAQDIFPVVKRAIPHSLLYIIGSHPPAHLRQLASESVIIMGYVPDLRPYFELATAYISPLEQPIGNPRALLKAAAMMTPLICSPAALQDLEFQHEQEALIAESDDEFIRAAIRLLREDQTRLRLQLNSRDKVQALYAWEQVTSQFEEVYQQLTQGQHHL